MDRPIKRIRIGAAALALAGGMIAAGLALGENAKTAAPGAALPPGSVLFPDISNQPRQLLHAEQLGGRQSYLVALGNTAFSSPFIFGEPARSVGLSCNACHINGDANPYFFIPKLSSRPGNIDTTNNFFHAPADNNIFDPVDIPSLRGIRFTAPYGRDGRIVSLREFVRNVIVVEFAGPEPSPLLLDALVAYLNEFEFVPNALLEKDGRLSVAAPQAAKRGEVLFNKNFAGMDNRSCASCHIPSAAFIDKRAHDLGSDGRFDTPTLLNANSTAPYFHDGRYADYAQVVGHFDRMFKLGLTAAEQADLVAYLRTVGGPDELVDDLTFRKEMSELATYVGVLDTALAARDQTVIDLVVDTVVSEMARVRKTFPKGEPVSHQSTRPDRIRAPVDYDALTAGLRYVAAKARAGDIATARAALVAYHNLAETMVANYPRLMR